jgi:hypothetical protein
MGAISCGVVRAGASKRSIRASSNFGSCKGRGGGNPSIEETASVFVVFPGVATIGLEVVAAAIKW